MSATVAAPLEAIRAMAVRLDDADHDYDALLDASVGRQFVLLGEATHGTREFYRMRADITRRLIVEQGFDAVDVLAARRGIDLAHQCTSPSMMRIRPSCAVDATSTPSRV